MTTRRCDRALACLYLYLDRELTWWRRLRIRRHLTACPPCEDGFLFEQRLKLVVRARLQEEVPDAVVGRLREMLRAEGGGGRPLT